MSEERIECEFVMDATSEIFKESELAQRMEGRKCVLVPIMEGDDVLNVNLLGFGSGISFHPDEKCGCILMQDKKYLGIRCDHFVWIEGWFENPGCDGLLLIGNNKGSLMMKGLLFPEDETLNKN